MRRTGVCGLPPPQPTRSAGPASRRSFFRGPTSSGRSRHPPADLLGPCPCPSPLRIISHTPYTTLTLVPSPVRPPHARFKHQRQLQSIFPAPPLGPKDMVQPCGISAAALCCVPSLSTSREPHSVAKPVLCSSNQERLFSEENLFIDIRGQARDLRPEPGPPGSLLTLPRPYLLPFPGPVLSVPFLQIL